ncbi:Sodium/hydrogen exchanger 9B2 [Chionoecetes opilio]|uniref:Sodium/hydrogen exchanger 9B2 n=1 Tax=Chionoecetes opilio TaxID=41210 RepID=A0A8J5CNF2_CHIOP|nr:Sodium/hydrogen exchanger 9B2 [Chionoecetes opilio]
MWSLQGLVWRRGGEVWLAGVSQVWQVRHGRPSSPAVPGRRLIPTATGGRWQPCSTIEETNTYLVMEPRGQEEREGTHETGCSPCFHPCLRGLHPLPSNPSRLQKLKYALLCPPHGRVGKWLTGLLIVSLVFGSLVSLLGAAALPGGHIFSLFIVFLGAEAAGRAMVPLHLPPLLGMLVVGILLKSVPGIDYVGKSIDPDWSAALRNIALVVILLRAGLGLDPAALKQLSLMVVRLAFTPCLVETLVVAVVTHFLLGFPWLWGVMLGFVLGAVTPAVIVPCMLVLSQKGYGVAKGIPTLVIAASSVDDVLAISGFGVLMGITFAEGELWVVILKGPFEVVVGVVYGVVLGALCWVLPVPSEHNTPVLRFVVLLAAGVVSLFGSPLIQLGGSGALGCLVMAFMAGYGWRRQGMTDEVDKLEGSTVGYGFLTLLAGLSFRMVTSFVVVMGGQLNLKERLFVALAWLPKATVQAAIGSQALDYARKTNAGPEEERLGEQVLTIAVLSILLTAPVGAAAIMLTAPRLLSTCSPAKDEAGKEGPE